MPITTTKMVMPMTNDGEADDDDGDLVVTAYRTETTQLLRNAAAPGFVVKPGLSSIRSLQTRALGPRIDLQRMFASGSPRTSTA